MFETMYSIKRIAAYAIDLVVVYIVGLGLNLLAVALIGSDPESGLGMIVFTQLAGSVISYGIPIVVFGSLAGLFGWTPGKLICFLRVKNQSGNTPGIAKGILREFIKFVGTSFLLLGAFWALHGIVTKQKTFYDDWLDIDVEDIKPSGLTETQKNWRKTFRK